MPGTVPLIKAISDDVVAKLAAQGKPLLTGGKILIGQQHVRAQSAPPRVVFVPTGSGWGPKSPASPSRVGTTPTNEQKAQWAARQLLTEIVHFRVHVWGAAAPRDPDNDLDATQLLYQQVIRSVHLLTAGAYALQPGTWTQSQTGGTALISAGWEFVFGLDFATPLLDTPRTYVPPDTTLQPTINFQIEGTP